MPSQAAEIASHLSPPLALVCYGLALLFGLYKLIAGKFVIRPGDAPPLALAMLRYSSAIITLLIILGSILVALPYMAGTHTS